MRLLVMVVLFVMIGLLTQVDSLFPEYNSLNETTGYRLYLRDQTTVCYHHETDRCQAKGPPPSYCLCPPFGKPCFDLVVSELNVFANWSCNIGSSHLNISTEFSISLNIEHHGSKQACNFFTTFEKIEVSTYMLQNAPRVLNLTKEQRATVIRPGSKIMLTGFSENWIPSRSEVDCSLWINITNRDIDSPPFNLRGMTEAFKRITCREQIITSSTTSTPTTKGPSTPVPSTDGTTPGVPTTTIIIIIFTTVCILVLVLHSNM